MADRAAGGSVPKRGHPRRVLAFVLFMLVIKGELAAIFWFTQSIPLLVALTARACVGECWAWDRWWAGPMSDSHFWASARRWRGWGADGGGLCRDGEEEGR